MKTTLGVIVLLGLASVTVWSSGALDPLLAHHQETVRAASPEKPTTIRALGYVEPVSELRRLVFKMDGVIDACLVEVGQQVKKDDLLMTLRNQGEQAAVALSEQELAVASAERNQLLAGTPQYQVIAAEDRVELLREHVRYAEKQTERAKALQTRKSITEADFDEYETEAIRAKKSLQQAESELAHLKNVVRNVDQAVADAKVKRAEAQLRAAKERLNDTVLTAPLDGTVLEILRREGEGPRLLDREPVIVFADTSRLCVRAEIDERFVANLKLNQKAVVFGRGLGTKKVEGSVVLIKGVMGPKTVFSREAAERKDLDIVQVLIDLPVDFQAVIGLQVDVEVVLE
ncbi:MAG: efflux RND transporter periplasmic adaptor subunit [Pirellulales bacterium]